MNDILSSEQLLSFLQTKRLGHSLKILSCTDSTNTQIKHNYKEAPEGFVLLAEQQTAGRGRLDRKFLSPKGDGIYFSLVLRPNRPMRDLSLLTPLAAVAVCEALQTVCGITSSIKWVNDARQKNLWDPDRNLWTFQRWLSCTLYRGNRLEPAV